MAWLLGLIVSGAIAYLVWALWVRSRRRRRPKPLISLLVPRRHDFGRRDRTWRWLERYWKCRLGADCEIIVGHDWALHRPFSKAVAVNDAARRAKGDVFVILDSDAYLPAKVIRHCAARLRHARKHGTRMWFVPYHHIFRLTEEATERVLDSDPCDPLRFPSPPCSEDVQDNTGSGHGHRYGAMITIMPREAFELVGGMDERFRGWGGEDVSFLRALNTLWAPYKKTPNQVLHLWHEKFHVGAHSDRASEAWRTRIWQGQDKARNNDWLSSKYGQATNRPTEMRALVDCGLPPARLDPKKVVILKMKVFLSRFATW